MVWDWRGSPSSLSTDKLITGACTLLIIKYLCLPACCTVNNQTPKIFQVNLRPRLLWLVGAIVNKVYTMSRSWRVLSIPGDLELSDSVLQG